MQVHLIKLILKNSNDFVFNNFNFRFIFQDMITI